MKAKRIISLLLALAMIVAVFAACGGDSNESSQASQTGP